MQENIKNKKLIKVNEISFTAREIDIIACIINGRSVKAISILLGISTNTINSHIKNIMSKANCFAKDQIIKLVESSENHILIDNVYIDLIVKSEFEKLLEDISKISTEKKHCIIHILNGKINEKFCNHLEMAGINFAVIEDSNINTKSENVVHIIQYSNDQEVKINPEKNTIFLFEDNGEILLKQKNNGFIDNYFYVVLECIQAIYQSSSINELVNKFKQYYDGKRQNDIKESNNNVPSFLVYKKLFIILLIAIFSTGIFTFLSFLCETKNNITLFNAPIISDDVLLLRKNIVRKIDGVFKSQKGIKFAILIGEGGSGKTVISRNYLQMNNFKVKAEINAETYTTIVDSFINLAIALAVTKELREEVSYITAIANQKIRDKQMISFVFSQLNKLGRWCLLFDDVDDFNMIKNFIPNNSGMYDGKILITTRNKNFENISVLPQHCAIDIGFLSDFEQKELFSKIVYGSNRNKESIKKDFLKKIPLLPLDVCAAAYYIKNTHVSLEEYLKIIQNPDQNYEKMHSTFLSEGANYNKSRYDIVSSVFEKIIKMNPDFKELLLFVCLLDSQNIPKMCLEKCKNQAIVQELLHNLRRFSLISEKDNTFSINKNTQEIVLKHILLSITEEEKIQYLNEIIKAITSYEEIYWMFYPEQKYKMSYAETHAMIPHLESILKKINLLNVHGIDKYKVKILLSLFHAVSNEKYARINQSIAEQIFQLNHNENYINEYDWAVFLLRVTYGNFAILDFSKTNKYLSKVLDICSKHKDMEQIKACALIYFARFFCETENFDKCFQYLKEGEDIVFNSSKPHFSLMKILCNQYCYCFLEYYIHKKEIATLLPLFLKTLNILNKEPWSLKNAYNIAKLKSNMVDIYNYLEQYDEALKYAREVNLFCSQNKADGWDFIPFKALAQIEEGFTLLRTNKLKEAEKILTQSIDVKCNLEDFYCISNAFLYRSEVNIRLNKLNAAYKDCQSSLKFQEERRTNYSKLVRIVSYYNMAFVRYKQNNLKESIEHFQHFFELSKLFCEDFLEKSSYEKLLEENAFEKITEESQIKICLQNSLKIFSAVYGKNHSFIENYVKNNQ